MDEAPEKLSVWWKRSVLIIVAVCFVVLIWVSSVDATDGISRQRYGRCFSEIRGDERAAVTTLTARLLKENRYDAKQRTLLFTPGEVFSYRNQKAKWGEYFFIFLGVLPLTIAVMIAYAGIRHVPLEEVL